ncbi:hypothetical protein [Nocardia pseudovaccinii]|uniref:hypothetical protein n=1 Tax=Nocardia pseudovaccinii TaxID=189540 RepID=UPI0012F519B6|nr:hypothetical protein [Nocardia pseudovaccinii]
MLREAGPADPAVILDKASSRGELGAATQRLRTLTLQMLGKGIPGSVPYFADRIITLWHARTADAEGTRMIQKLHVLHRNRDLSSTGPVVARARAWIWISPTLPPVRPKDRRTDGRRRRCADGFRAGFVESTRLHHH